MFRVRKIGSHLKSPKSGELWEVVERHRYTRGGISGVFYTVEFPGLGRLPIYDQEMGNAPGKWLPVPDETEEVENLD
jgi:hypothetical protein